MHVDPTTTAYTLPNQPTTFQTHTQRVLRAAVEGPGLVPVVGKDVVSDLIDLVEEPLLLFMPKIIRPRNEEMLYRGQRAAVEVLYQLVLASDRCVVLFVVGWLRRLCIVFFSHVRLLLLVDAPST